MAFRDNVHRTPHCNKDNSLISINKTPKSGAKENRPLAQKTPTRKANITFNKSRGGLKRRDGTPSRNPNFSGIGGGDRFIPNRSGTQFELATHILSFSSENESLHNTSASAPVSPTKAEKAYMVKVMRAKSANDVDQIRDTVLCYQSGHAPAPPLFHNNEPKVLYTTKAVKPSDSVSKGIRYIPNSPERILDAPNFLDDYYMNVIHWSSDNVIAVALTYALYLWNASTGEITTLFELPEHDGIYITSVQWAYQNSVVAAGLSNGQIKLYDPSRSTPLRTMQSQISRVGCLSWRQHVLSAGCRSGLIYHHDVRVANHLMSTCHAHAQEVCGLVWSGDGRYLASGGGDNMVRVWEPNSLGNADPMPLHSFDDHVASVKALAFNPHHPHSLATGGGTTDRTVKFWNLATGTLCHSQDTMSQVNGIAFTPNYKEFITAHGYPGNELKIWKYPSMACLKVLTGHAERVLGLTMSPCGQYVMSASSDESLRLWWCFKVDKTSKNKPVRNDSRLSQSVR